MDRKTIGVVRAVALDAPVWASPAFGIEITLSVMPSEPVAPHGRHDYTASTPVQTHVARVKPLPTTPAAEFDLALIVPNDVPAQRVAALMRKESGDMLETLELFDEFPRRRNPRRHPLTLARLRLTFRHPAIRN